MRLLRSQFQITSPDLLKAVSAPFLLAIPYTLLILVLKKQVPIDGWIYLAIAMVGPVTSYLITASLFVLNREDRQVLLKRFGIVR